MRFLLDEMFSRAAATLMHEEFDHDALHVGDVGLHGADDMAVATFARSEHRAVVIGQPATSRRINREPRCAWAPAPGSSTGDGCGVADEVAVEGEEGEVLWVRRSDLR